jgi:hypothetical protein
MAIQFTADHYLMLQSSYLKYFPEQFPLELISDYSSILRYQKYLKNSKPERRLLCILLNTVLEKIERGQRFQKILILKLILHHLKYGETDQEIKIKVFKIYQELILNEPDDVCWKLSNMLKNRELLPYQIDWLLDNIALSEHILNRVLRYPVKNKSISRWAETAIHNEELWNRRSEIIGCILNYRPKFRHKNHQNLVWGIYYSKLTHEEKKVLLDKYFYADNLSELLKICDRQNYTDLIKKWFQEISLHMESTTDDDN